MNGNYYINSDIGLPIYKQVVSQIEQKIISGEYAPGFLLPSMNELSAELDISKETIKKAYSILRDKGVIEPGKDTPSLRQVQFQQAGTV